MEKVKRKWGDRKDGRLLRELDAMHFIVPLIFPNRCDNEAYIAETIDLTNINAYIAKKNETETDYPYKLFQLIVCAMLKTLILRPKMNRFIANKNVYQRYKFSASFVVKKEFADEGGEALAFVYAEDDDTLSTIRAKMLKQIRGCRSDAMDTSSNSMDILNKLPRFLSKFLVWVITRLDIRGWCPDFLIGSDPYYSSVLLTNVGSIKLHSGYHHLANWGTNSVFCLVGEKKLRPVFDEQGYARMCDTVQLGLTIDERIADGYYYSKTLKLLRHLLENPELLELPLSEKVEY